jgi:hypothetical protein
MSLNSITKKEKPMMVFSFDMATGKFTGGLKSLKADEILNVYKIDEYGGKIFFFNVLKYF